ncbi:MAG: hypothetical protein DRI70_09110, partial [Bacteroidetes bacterium]
MLPLYEGRAETIEDIFFQGNIKFYPKPVPVLQVKRKAVISPNKLTISYRRFTKAKEGTQNIGVHIRIKAIEPWDTSVYKEKGFQLLKIISVWKNVHAKQITDQKSVGRKADRTMGAGGLFSGQAKGGSSESQIIERDVAYKVPKWSNHLFLLADGIAYPVDILSTKLNKGGDPSEGFGIARYGQEREVQHIFRIPVNSKNLALQFFDYTNKNIQIPLAGDIKLARGTGYPPGVVDKASASGLELGVVNKLLSKSDKILESKQKWSLLTMGMMGKSNIRKGNRGNIAQIDAKKYVWLEGHGGLDYPVSELNSRTRDLRFTPEYFSYEGVSFIVPDSLLNYRLAIRLGSKVSYMKLSEKSPTPPPKPFKSFIDGNVAQWHIYSITETNDGVLVDMGVQGSDPKKGIEIKPYRQIQLSAGNKIHKPDKNKTLSLAYGAKNVVVVPTKGTVRFVLAFNNTPEPTILRIQG